MKSTLLILFTFLIAGLTAHAGRGYVPPNDELLKDSAWVFTGRVQRYETSPGAFIGTMNVKCIVRVMRVLRGAPPAFVVMRGSVGVPTNDGHWDFVFFAKPQDPPIAGVQALNIGIRPLSELREIEQLIGVKSPDK